MSSPRARNAACLLILAVALATYWPVLHCGFVWDDDDYVTQNPVLRTWGGFLRIWFEPLSLPQYYPLVHSSFWLEYRLWGLAPIGFHVVNVLLHAASGCLLFGLLRRLAIPGALFAALWFVAHPVHVESVAWVTERKNVLSLLCYLAAAHSWLRWHDGGTRRHWVLGTTWFVCALLSKTVAATLPASLLVLVWWRDGVVTRRAVRGVLAWFVVGTALAWFTVHLESTHVGASATPWQLVGAQRVLVAGRAVWFYLGSLVWPFGVCFNYPRWHLDTASLAQWGFVVAAIAAIAGAIVMRPRLGRGPAAVLLLFGGALVPALGFFDVFPFRYSFVADHFQYHASVPMLVGLAALSTQLVRRLGKPAVAIAGATLVVAVSAGFANRQVDDYRDFETLWQRTLAKNPDSALAMMNLGALATQREDAATARPLLERSLEIDPTASETHVNLGVLAHRAGDLPTARMHYEAGLALKPNDPNVRNNLASLELDQGKPAEAMRLLDEAVQLDPDYYDAHVTRTRAGRDLGRWQQALADCDWVLSRTPDAVATRRLAIDCMMHLGQFRPAAANALVLLRQQPESVDLRDSLAVALANVLRADPPPEIFQRAGNACRNGGIEPGAILPLLERQLRSLGATAQADAIAAGMRAGH